MMKRIGFFGSLLALPLFSSRVSAETLYGSSSSGEGVRAHSDTGDAVYAYSQSGDGVYGQSPDGTGIYGISVKDDGVRGVSTSGYGVHAESEHNHAIYAKSASETSAILGLSDHGVGVGAETAATEPGTAAFVGKGKVAALLQGTVGIVGPLSVVGTFAVNGVKAFQIDHPFHPTTKYLTHSCVESDEMLNIYSGVAVLDSSGEAEINLPDWFEALNEDLRYQLTALGAPGPNLHIKQEIRQNRFTSAGGSAGMRVSWQVAGRRHDAYAKAHPLQVEQDKPSCELGTYGHPTAFGQPAELASARVYWPERRSFA